MNRILVTGAQGFIGRHCIPRLSRRGFEVHAVSSTHPEGTEGGVIWHKADLLDPSHVVRVVSTVAPTHMLHLAWISAPGLYLTSAQNLDWVVASIGLIKAFIANGGERAVGVGSCAEYDWRYGYCRESFTPLLPDSLYGACKLAVGSIFEAIAGNLALSSAWARVFFAYGPHEPPGRLVSSAISSLLRGEEARCSSGEQTRDYLYVEDVADALLAILSSSVRGPVNIASGRPVSVAEVASQIGKLLNKSDMVRLGAIEETRPDPAFLVADVTRLRLDVGWSPAFSLQDGLQRTIEWWRAQSDARSALDGLANNHRAE